MSANDTHYRRSLQSPMFTHIVMSIMMVVFFYLYLGHDRSNSFGVTIIAAIVFYCVFVWIIKSALIITVTDDVLTWSHRFGLFKRRVDREDISAAKAVDTKSLIDQAKITQPYGWGLKTEGLNAVEVTTRSGRSATLATDDPEALVAVLDAAE